MAQNLAFISPHLTTSNVGDLFINDSVKRILVFDREHSTDIDPRRPITPRDIDEINQRDAAVIVGTNLWYRSLRKEGRWMFSADDLRTIRVPIIPFGVGTTRHTGEDNRFDADTLEQLRIIHGGCRLASVRDPRTLQCLTEAGVANVVMTGCPTLFRSLRPQWRLAEKDHARVVVTVRKGQARNIRRLIMLLKRRNLEPVVAAQVQNDNFLRRSIPFIRKPVTTLYQFDIRPYLDLVEQSRGAIGWRLHGNMLHLAHGNRAAFFANCSRANSFCEHFCLPCTPCEDGAPLEDAQLEEMIDRLLDDAMFAHFAPVYEKTRAAMAAFLEANNLQHNLRS